MASAIKIVEQAEKFPSGVDVPVLDINEYAEGELSAVK
jgi:hypothetical protein